jgi:CubicO group peptidase (beta-lactamase class C family)
MRLYLLFIGSLFVLRAAAQPADTSDIVKTQGIVSPLQRANLGKIAFTSRDIPLSQLKEKDFLHEYELTNKSNLFINAFMQNSVINYIHRLAPGLPADSLIKAGTYQFTLFIDRRLIYKSNISAGTYLTEQDKETTVSKPLIDNQHEGNWWSQYFWGRFMHSGGDSALTEGHHLLRMEIRPYIKLGNEVKEGQLMAAGELNVMVKRKPVIDLSKVRLNPILPYDGFGVSTETFDTNKIKELKGDIEADVFRHISSVVVIKNANILIEEYFNGEGRDSLHDPRSVGKSFASTMLGVAINEGYIKSEEQTLQDFYPVRSFANYAPEKDKVQLKDLLTMCSAFDGDDDDGDSPGNEENMYPTDNWVKWTLDLPLSQTRPRDQWHYFTAGAMLLGDILNQHVPGGLETYADLRLFAPLGIRDYHWMYTPQHVANTAGGIRLKALDFAKYGQLYKNGGQWQGRQILPAAWVAKTFTRYHSVRGSQDDFYGYLFWNKLYHVNGKVYEAWYCSGNGGNSIFVFPNEPLVVVITATAYGAPYAHPQVDRMMTDFILPAVLGGK